MAMISKYEAVDSTRINLLRSATVPDGVKLKRR